MIWLTTEGFFFLENEYYEVLYHGNDSAYFAIFLYKKYNLYVVSKSLYNKRFILLVIVNEKINLFNSAQTMVYLDSRPSQVGIYLF